MTQIRYRASENQKAKNYIGAEKQRDPVLQKLMDASPQEVGRWIENSVDDPDVAAVLKRMGMLIRYLLSVRG